MPGTKGRSGGTRPGAGRPVGTLRTIRLRVGDAFAVPGRAADGLATVVSVERGGFRVRFESGEEMVFTGRMRSAEQENKETSMEHESVYLSHYSGVTARGSLRNGWRAFATRAEADADQAELEDGWADSVTVEERRPGYEPGDMWKD